MQNTREALKSVQDKINLQKRGTFIWMRKKIVGFRVQLVCIVVIQKG